MTQALALPTTVTLAQIEAAQLYQRQRKTSRYFPDEGPYRRELYAKHLEFFDAGRTCRERLFIAANRVGKTDGAAYEVQCHATGVYPHWWTGRRFTRPTQMWVANTNWETVRDVNQMALIGPPDNAQEWGTGMIPHSAILDIEKNPHVKNGVLLVKVRYRDSRREYSVLQFKNYEQGRESFQGTEKDVIWGDEEIPMDVYGEMVLRTLVGNGMLMLTYMPLKGMTETTKLFFSETPNPHRRRINAGWRDVPHLSKEACAELELSIPPHLRGARIEGLPSSGLGMVYPIDEAAIKCEDFPIPDHYVRCGGLDTGWNFTAGVWLARNNDTGIVYLYDCYKGSEEKPPIHAEAFKMRGAWIPISGDCAAINVTDGEQLIKTYRQLGVKVSLPDKRSKNANVQAVWIALQTGKLKIFASCTKWFEEFRLYHRNEKGEIVKTDDHIMDATQYAFISGLPMAITKPVPRSKVLPPTTAWT